MQLCSVTYMPTEG